MGVAGARASPKQRLHRRDFVVAALFSGGLMGWMSELNAEGRLFAAAGRHVPKSHRVAQKTRMDVRNSLQE
jgi:hypothetical protein